MREILQACREGRGLDRPTSRAVFARLAAGALSEIELAGLLMGLAAKGETAEEVAGAAEAFRAAALGFPRPEGSLADSAGTGGDGAHTLNLSTAAALVAAAGGVRVVKHGNRSVSSRCGSADVLETLGARLELAPEQARSVLDACGHCFLFAPLYHPGLRHAVTTRRGLGVPTILNILGPLLNPARPDVQLLGVARPELVDLCARTLALLGCRRALVVHGAGLDELGLHAPAEAVLVRDGELESLQIDATDHGLARAGLKELAGGDPPENAAWLRQVLRGGGARAPSEAVALNAGALLWLDERVECLGDGVQLALELMAQGSPGERLDAFVEASRAC